MNSNEWKIASAVVPDELRLNFLPCFLGRHYAQGESLVYAWAGRLCAAYRGDHWNFITLTNGGFYMAPAESGRVAVRWHLNGYSDMMGADAFGVTVTLYALCHLAEMKRDDTIIDRYHQLREFASQHVEAANILRAID